MPTAMNGVGTTIFADDAEYPVVSSNPHVQAAYMEMRRNGESHNLAEMLAFRRAPDIRTDSTFLAGTPVDDDPIVRRWRAEAEAEGVNTTGAVYFSKIAEYPGDPKAFVRGRGDIVRRCEELNRELRLDGRLVVPLRDEPPAPEPDIDPDSIADRLEHHFDANPGMEEECVAKPEMLKEAWHNAKESLKPDYSS